MDSTKIGSTSAVPAADVQEATAITYIVDVSDVREVALSGTANIAFWIDKLSRAGLHPTNTQGQATVVVSATSLKWMGLRFRERPGYGLSEGCIAAKRGLHSRPNTTHGQPGSWVKGRNCDGCRKQCQKSTA